MFETSKTGTGVKLKCWLEAQVTDYLLTAVLIICVQDLKSSRNWKTGGRKPYKIPELPYLKWYLMTEASSTKEISPDNNSYDLSGSHSIPCKTVVIE